MATQSQLARLGLRLGTLGSLASLALACPIAEGDSAQAAHTYASRTGIYCPTPTSISLVAAGAERVRLWDDGGVQIGGAFAASPGPGILSVAGSIVLPGATSGSASIAVAAIAGSPATLVLPTTSGAAGEVLRTDGAGILSWVSVATPSFAIISVAISTLLDATYYTVLVDATAAPIAITLPLASGANGRVYNVKKIDATANAVTITRTGGDLIDGATTQALTVQYQARSVQALAATNTWNII